MYDDKGVLHDEDRLMVVIRLILQTLKLLLCSMVLCIYRTKSLKPQLWRSPCRGECLIASADLDGCAGRSVANGKTSHAGDFEGEKPDPERNHRPSGLLGVCDGLATHPEKKSRVDTYLKCDKPENVAKSDREPVAGVTLENCCRWSNP